MPPPGFGSPSALRAIRELLLERSRRLSEAAHSRLRHRWPDVTVHATDGDPHERIFRAAEEWKPDLAIVGRSAGENAWPFLGSVARLTARYLPCSVLLVDREPIAIGEVVVGMDGSASAREAVRLLSRFPFAATARVLALGIVSTSWRRTLDLANVPPVIRAAVHDVEAQRVDVARTILARTVADLAGHASVESEVATGNPAEVLLYSAGQRKADLLVLGHQGLEPVRRLALGSVTEQVLAAAPCSLLIGRQ